MEVQAALPALPDTPEYLRNPQDQWAVGARPLAAGAPPDQARVVETNLGLAFSDPGANVSVVSAKVADRFPGGRLTSLENPEQVYGAANAAGHRPLLFTSNRTLTVELTIHYSFDDPERGTSAGLLPTIKELAMPLELKVCDDPLFFSALVPGLPQLSVVLGDEVEKLPAWQRFYSDFLSASQPGGPKMWTHSQRVSQQGRSLGSTLEEQRYYPAAIPLDVPDGDPLPYPARSPFQRDSLLDLTSDSSLDADTVPPGTPLGKTSPSDDRGDSKIPKSLAEMHTFLKANQPNAGRVFDRYSLRMAALLLKHRETLLEPRPSTKIPPLDCKVLPGTVPTRAGLHRRHRPEAIPAMNAEARSLAHHGMAVKLPWKQGEPLPPNLFINGVVVTIRRPPAGAPPDAPVRIRMCIDPQANSHSAQTDVKTVLPSVEEHVGALQGASLLTSFDMPNAFSQNRLTDQASDLFGFCIPDENGELQLYKMTGAPFGWHLFPALFQARMEAVLAGTLTCPNSVARAYIDDAYVATKGAHGERLSDVWGAHSPTPAETSIINDHFLCMDLALQGYRDFGYVISLKKCLFLREQIPVLGLLCDGISRTIDPDRVDGFLNLGKPTNVTLHYLQQICGTLNYMSPFMGMEYQQRSEPLFELARVTARALSAAGKDRMKTREAMALPNKLWDATHDASLLWCIDAMRHSQTRYFLRFDKPVHLISDASDTGVAACLAQYDENGLLRICYTLSRRFTTQQKKWSVGAREVYGLLLACRQWSKYLHFCQDLVIESDHHNIVTSLSDLENTALARWVLELNCWDAFTRARVHRRGAVNILMDTLSRQSASFTLHQRDEPLAQQFSPILSSIYPKSNMVRVITRGAAAAPPAPTFPPPLVGGGGAAEEAHVPPITTHKGAGNRAGVAQRPAAAAAAAALTTATPVSTPPLDIFDNPHQHALTPFMENVLLAQASIPPATLQAYLSDKRLGLLTRQWSGRQVLLAKGRILVPEEPRLMHDIFAIVHDGALHCGAGAVQERLVKAKLYIPRFQEHFGAYYAACSCQHARAPHQEQPHGQRLLTPRQWPLAHLYIDFCSLPYTDEVRGKNIVGAVVIVDAASRACEFTAVEDKTALTAVACLQRWINHWGRPVMVHCDNGSHFTGSSFTEFLSRTNIAFDPGTAYHPEGRGLVERLVGKLKDGLQRLLPQGKLLLWPTILSELELLVNQAPHRALGGISPYDYLLRGHRYREEKFIVVRDDQHPHGKVYLNWAHSLPGDPSPQRGEDLALCLDTMRQIADWCAEISSLKESINSESTRAPFHAKVGDFVLKLVAIRENSLEPFYQGPYVVTQDLGKDFYTVCELLADNAKGKPVQVHASRLIRYDISRSSADEEHQRKLPPDHYVVEAVLRGPDLDHEGHFLVKWLGITAPRWEPAHALRQVLKFRQFCHDSQLTLEGKPTRRTKLSQVPGPQPPNPAQLRVLRHGYLYNFEPAVLSALH